MPLDTPTRVMFEPRFGRDLGDVRLHTGGPAAEMSRSYGARAYTVGHDIVFSPGQYEPHTEAGRRLIAHELAHVAQAGNHEAGEASSVAGVEREASHAAERALRGLPAAVHTRVSAATPLFQLRRDDRADERDRRRGIRRGMIPRVGPPRYWDYDRQGREGDSPTFTDRSATEAIVMGCVEELRPTIPEWYDPFEMGSFDCQDLYGQPGQFDFRGRVMDGWEVNYYFISMAMAHQGWDWSEAQAIIIAWNASQSIGINPYGGGGDMTDEMWFAAHEGFSDEYDRMLLVR
jgi:hypothetical protein